MDASQWPQGIGVVKEDSVPRRTKPEKDEAIECPRCSSTNTKFCYYNNYSLSQPRYFCKTCRRYWTAGGSLRNVPVGGGSRKNKRPTPSSHQSQPTSSTKIKLDHHHDHDHDQNPSKIEFQGQDLNLAHPGDHHFVVENGNPSMYSNGGLGFGFGFDNGGRVLFPFGEGGAAVGYWGGMLGGDGGGSW